VSTLSARKEPIMRSLFAICVALLFAPLANGQQLENIKNRPPQFAEVRLTAGGEVEIRYPIVQAVEAREVVRMILTEPTGQVNELGRPIMRTVSRDVPRIFTREVTTILTTVHASVNVRLLRDNRPVDIMQVPEVWTPVIWNHSKEPLEAFYQQFLAKEALVMQIVLPEPPPNIPEPAIQPPATQTPSIIPQDGHSVPQPTR
jgi:hypothetical protein